MQVEEALAIVEQMSDRGCLSKIEQIVFRHCWEGRSYLQIAQTSGYDPGYIKDMGYRLWQRLSEACGEKVTKQNFKGVLRRAAKLGDREQGTEDRNESQVLTSIVTRQDWGDAIDVSIFYGRSQEFTTLQTWIVEDRCRLVTLLGMGGMGKTSLSVKVAQEVVGDREQGIGNRGESNLSPVPCHLSPVPCHLSPVTCHLSPVTFPICHLAIAPGCTAD